MADVTSTQAAVAKARSSAKTAEQTQQNARKRKQTEAANAAKVKDLKKQNDKLHEENASSLKRIKQLEPQYIQAGKTYVNYVNSHPTPTPEEILYIAQLDQQVKVLEGQIKVFKDQIDKNTKTIKKNAEDIVKLSPNSQYSVRRTLVNTKGAGSTSTTVTTTDANAPKGQKKSFSEDYKYNAPMVSTSYFGTPSFVDIVLDGQYVDQGKYSDARQAWKGTTGGRGTMQMDKKFLSSFTAKDLESKSFDLQKYGFKFLYNPQTISMAWGLIQEMDPYFEATGMDKFQVVSTALLSSTVSFEILLNRIEDFNFIDSTGLRSGLTEGSSNRSLAKNPYPENVSNEDLKEIYNKGTMYDLEYLFKVINGPNASFKSDLNGNTADRGWMKPVIVELHLGNAMRYRVRISEFSVNHIIFNNRMVPILSTVKFTCSRFADGLPDKAPLPSSSSNSGPSSTTTASGSRIYTGPRGRR